MRLVPLLLLVRCAAALSHAATVNLVAFNPRIRRTDSRFTSQCQACGAHSLSPAGATTRLACLCVPGFTRVGDDCLACAAGTYKGFYGPAACMSCPPNSTSAGASINCTCAAGYSRSAALRCEPCERGFYKLAPGDGVCSACPVHTFADAPASTSKCAPCHTHSSAPAASPSEAACLCDAVHFLSALRDCAECPVNRYCPAADNAAHNCTAHSHGGPGLRAAAQCVCDDGHARAGGPACFECAADTFCRNDTRTECNAHSASPRGSAREEDCVCDGGFARPEAPAP